MLTGQIARGRTATRAPPALDLEAEQPSEIAEHHGRHNGTHEHDDHLLRLADRNDATGLSTVGPAGAPNHDRYGAPAIDALQVMGCFMMQSEFIRPQELAINITFS